jgi:hypothetical protein
MMLERNNKVMNVGKAKFVELILDVLQLFTLEEFPYAISRIIKQITCQEGLASTKGNKKDLCIKCVIKLFYDQLFNFLNQLPTISIHNRMVMNTKMNHRS